uniref:Uncharacterized protein n=1 Tax=Ditylenchus dipsaci TaxID=166011 RepID=A0A915DUE3_9BILA
MWKQEESEVEELNKRLAAVTEHTRRIKLTLILDYQQKKPSTSHTPRTSPPSTPADIKPQTLAAKKTDAPVTLRVVKNVDPQENMKADVDSDCKIVKVINKKKPLQATKSHAAVVDRKPTIERGIPKKNGGSAH